MENLKSTIKYEVVFEEQKEGGFTAYVPSLPGCISEGDSFEQVKNNIQEAIELYLESVVGEGEDIPDNSRSIFIGQVISKIPV